MSDDRLRVLSLTWNVMATEPPETTLEAVLDEERGLGVDLEIYIDLKVHLCPLIGVEWLGLSEFQCKTHVLTTQMIILGQEPSPDFCVVGFQETCQLTARRLLADGTEWDARTQISLGCPSLGPCSGL